MSTPAEGAAQATFEQRYQTVLQDNVRLVAENDALKVHHVELRADLMNATRAIEELRAQLAAAKEGSARLQAANDLLDDLVPADDQVVILKVDYERLLASLPATSPGLKVVPNEPVACLAQIFNRSTGGRSLCSRARGHEGLHEGPK